MPGWPDRRPESAAADGDRFRHVLERQHDDVLVVAAVDPDVAEEPKLEARKFRRDRVAARRQPFERRGFGVKGLCRGRMVTPSGRRRVPGP